MNPSLEVQRIPLCSLVVLSARQWPNGPASGVQPQGSKPLARAGHLETHTGAGEWPKTASTLKVCSK